MSLPFDVEDIQHNVEELFGLKSKGGNNETDSGTEKTKKVK